MAAAALPWLVPSAISALGLLLGMKGNKPTLDPQQQAMQNQALQIQNSRMIMQNPLFEMLTQGAMSRQPRSAMPASYQLQNYGGNYPTQGNPMQRFNPGMLQNGSAVGSAVQALARGIDQPRGRMRREAV
jgi:hypothetical protein